MQADYRPNTARNYYNRNDVSNSGVSYRLTADVREHISELETYDAIEEAIESKPPGTVVAVINANNVVPPYIRCKDDMSAIRVPLMGHISIGPADQPSAPEEGKMAFLEVETTFSSSTAFETDSAKTILAIDVGSVLADAVAMGLVRYYRSAYLMRMVCLYHGIVKSFVRDKFVIGVDFTLNHRGYVSDDYDSFVIQASARFSVNRLQSRIQRAEDGVESSSDFSLDGFSIISD